jgi:hypothetical protein
MKRKVNNLMKNPSRKINWLVISILVVIVIAISAPMYYYRIMNATDSDYSNHILYTYKLLAREPWPVLNEVHPLLQILLGGMSWISRSRIDPFAGMIIFLVACQVVMSLLLFSWFGKLARRGWDWIKALVAISLIVIAPVFALVPFDNRYYFGYIGLADYRNPNMPLLRVLSFISFYFAVNIFKKSRNPVWMLAVSAFVTILSALAKPNYLLCILPTIFLVGIIWTIRKQEWDWRLFLFGFLVPGIAILFVQWLLSYGAGISTTILIYPFAIKYFSNYIFLKFLLSILFPLVATSLLFRKMIRDPYILLSWIGFAAGAVMFYFFAESGSRLYALNFQWGAEVMLFLLIASIVRFCLKTFTEEKAVLWKRLLIWGVYLLYVGFGILYYIHCITGSSYA